MGIKKWLGLGMGVIALGGAAAFAQYRNIEVPSHTVIKSEQAFELRDYAPMIVAEVTHSGTRREASSRSFSRLAAYIFGQDRPEGGDEIAMTSPVMQDRVDQNAKIAMTSPVLQEETTTDKWRMRFVMPAKFTLETLPTPPEDITITQMPARRVAVVKFSGNGSASDLADMEEFLSAWIADQKLIPQGGFEYAFYDAPMVPGPMRRNEVFIEVAAE